MTDTIVQLLRDGIAAAKAGNKPVTRKLLRQVVELDSQHEVAWLWLAGVAETPQQALDALERVLEINPSNERAKAGIKSARLQAAVSLAKTGHRGPAKALLERVVREDPRNETALLWLAGVTDDPDRAIEHLQAVLKINPNNTNAQSGIARLTPAVVAEVRHWDCPLCSHQSNVPAQRCAACRAIIDLSQIEQLLTDFKVDTAKMERAIKRLSSLPQSPDVVLHEGLALFNLQRFDEAADKFQQVIRLQPANRSRTNLLNAVLRRMPAIHQQLVNMARESAQKTVLVIDDSPTIRKVVSLALTPTEHRVLTAAGANDALEVIRKQGIPQLIFLDIMMPGMDGYELCKLLRQTAETSKIPVIMLSGKDGFFSKIRGRMCGASGYITKPFETRELLELVAKYCGVVPRATQDIPEQQLVASY